MGLYALPFRHFLTNSSQRYSLTHDVRLVLFMGTLYKNVFSYLLMTQHNAGALKN